MRRVNIAGKSYGRLTAIEFSHNSRGNAQWLCECVCGNKKTIAYSSLYMGYAKSCGCLKREETIKRFTTHGLTYSPEYYIHGSMIDRCKNNKNKAYKSYGGRGIRVCERWATFDNFIEDMGRRPSSLYSIDRIDVNGDYCLENCRWATKQEQMANMRRNRNIDIDGEIKTLSQWAAISGILSDTIAYRLNNGWSVKDAVFKAPRGKPT